MVDVADDNVFEFLLLCGTLWEIQLKVCRPHI